MIIDKAPSATQKHRGRSPRRVEMTAGQIDATAVSMIRSGLSQGQMIIIDALANGGVMTGSQLKRLTNLSYGTIANDYLGKMLLDRLRLPDLTHDDLAAAGVCSDKTGATIYTLGAVGLRVAERRRAPRKPVPNGFVGFNGQRILHDLIVNEVALRLGQKAGEKGWTFEWIDKQRATVYDERGSASLEPDALFLLRYPGFERMMALEYHNEDRGNRAMLKVEKYQAAYQAGRWRAAWETEVMPMVAVVFRHDLIGANYVDAIEKATKSGLKVKFVGKPLAQFLAAADEGWVDFKSMAFMSPFKLPNNPEAAKKAVTGSKDKPVKVE